MKNRVLGLILLTLGTNCSLAPVQTSQTPTAVPQAQVSPSPVVAPQAQEITTSLLEVRIDQEQLGDILQASPYAPQLSQWHSKILLAKLDEQQQPAQLQGYAYHSIYADSNQNTYQDQGDAGFFNPASTVKVGIAALALEKLNTLNLSRQAEYQLEGDRQWHGIGADVQRALVISDNEATNRLIYWLGFDPLNTTLQAKGVSSLVVNRLMLDQGTLVPSPLIRVRDRPQILNQPPIPVHQSFACWEKPETLGNCATAMDLVGILARLTHPHLFAPEQRFKLRDQDRAWLLRVLTLTPKQTGFDYADDYCRFLTGVERQLARQQGRMLSKCGVALFAHSYIDTSYLQTDQGEQYFMVVAVSPPRSTPEPKILETMADMVLYALPRLSDPSSGQ